MDNKDEYQDPDYHVPSAGTKNSPTEVSEMEKLEKIKKIIRREFSNELEAREKEVILIDQKLTSSRRLLHKLRYALVNNYYKQERLQLSSGQMQDDLEALSQAQAKPELSTLLREGQRQIHPSVRKLLGKDTVDLSEIFKSREPRNKIRKDYNAMIRAKNVTTAADATKSLRPASKEEKTDVEVQRSEESKEPVKPKKIPRHLEPKILNVFTIDEATRNKMKQRYRIIIGNTSKYAPPSSRADRSTHKWLLYIRGCERQPDLSRVLTAATVRLHHSYAPHHTVRLHKPPFHVSRRGWGEFPAKIELHFALPSRNRPATVEHTIKLDRNYTGLQTLGAETIVDVWLYSTPEMLEYEYKEPINECIKTELGEKDTETQQTELDTQATKDGQNSNEKNMPMPMVVNKIKEEPDEMNELLPMDDAENSWMEFFSNTTTEVNVDDMLVKTNTDPDDNSILRNVLTNNRNDIHINETEILESQEINTDNMDTAVSDEDNILKVPMDIIKQPALEKKRIVKYIEPYTGKIYYLEMDRKLDLSKVQEIIIESENGAQTAKISPMKSNGLRNVRRPKKMVSLLKPEFKLNNKNENIRKSFNHIENDHCYFSTSREAVESTEEAADDDTCSELDERSDEGELTVLQAIQQDVLKLSNVRMVVDYALKKIPIISAEARKTNYIKCFPFVVESEERYWKLDFAKRRNIEWSRAKLINKILLEKFGASENVWRTKQILIYSRLHGYYPIRTESLHRQTETDTEDWSSWNDLENSRKIETNIKEIYPSAADISSLSVFDSKEFIEDSITCVDMVDSEEEIDVVETKCEVKTVLPMTKDVTNLTVLPVESDDDRLMFLYIERKCADIGIELRNEDVGNGCSYSAVHAVLLSAMKSFAEELIRSSLACKLDQRRHLDRLPSVWVGSSSACGVRLEHVLAALLRRTRLHALSARAMAAPARDTAAPL